MKNLLQLALVFTLCGSTWLLAGPSHSKVVYKSSEEIYITNGFGEMPTKILQKVPKGIIDGENAFDSYFHASLSPDEKFVAAVRIKNHKAHNNDRRIETYEAILYSIENEQEHIFYQLPPTSDINKVIVSPVWSKDGKYIYFLAGTSLLSYEIATMKTKKITDFPDDTYIFGDMETWSYIRLSQDGSKIFALLNHSTIWETKISTGKLTKLWDDIILGLYNVVNEVPQKLSQEAVTALFGSREFPVYNPRFSADGTFYYYYNYREGFFSRYWIGGHSLHDNENFIIRTIGWDLYTE